MVNLPNELLDNILKFLHPCDLIFLNTVTNIFFKFRKNLQFAKLDSIRYPISTRFVITSADISVSTINSKLILTPNLRKIILGKSYDEKIFKMPLTHIIFDYDFL